MMLVLKKQILLIKVKFHYIVDGRTANVMESNMILMISKNNSIKNANMLMKIHVEGGSMHNVYLKMGLACNILVRDAPILR